MGKCGKPPHLCKCKKKKSKPRIKYVGEPKPTKPGNEYAVIFFALCPKKPRQLEYHGLLGKPRMESGMFAARDDLQPSACRGSESLIVAAPKKPQRYSTSAARAAFYKQLLANQSRAQETAARGEKKVKWAISPAKHTALGERWRPRSAPRAK